MLLCLMIEFLCWVALVFLRALLYVLERDD